MLEPEEIPDQFKDLTSDPDVTIMLRIPMTLDDHLVIYERWFVDHINGESIIFIASEVDHLSDEQLEALVRTSPIIQPDSRVTFRQSESGYRFINFNFEVED